MPINEWTIETKLSLLFLYIVSVYTETIYN